MRTQSSTRRRSIVVVAAAGKKKGFGAPAAKPATPDPKKNPIPQPPQPPSTLDARFAQASAAAEAAAEGRPAPLSDDDFSRRLAKLKRESEAKASAAAEEVSAKGTTVFDSGIPDYDSPPPLSRTIASAMSGGSSDSSTPASTSGSGGVAAAVAAVALAAVFVFTSGGFGGDGGGSRAQRLRNISSASSAFRQRKLSEAERTEVQEQLERYRATLSTTPNDAAALRGAADAVVALGDADSEKQALSYLEGLTESTPRDPEAWSALGDARARAGDGKGAVAAFERARAETDGAPPLSLVAAAAGARAANGDPAGAVADVAAERSAALKRGDESGAYDLALLQAKVLSETSGRRGASAEADAIYAELTETRPGDFRGWLARGVLARSDGRAGDAARYFLRAKAAAAESGGEGSEAVAAISGLKQ